MSLVNSQGSRSKTATARFSLLIFSQKPLSHSGSITLSLARFVLATEISRTKQYIVLGYIWYMYKGKEENVQNYIGLMINFGRQKKWIDAGITKAFKVLAIFLFH